MIISGDGCLPDPSQARRVKLMIWKRMSAGFDGCLNGDQKFGFPQNRVPGAGANPTTILRNFHDRHPTTPITPPHLRLLYGLLLRPRVRLLFRHHSIYSALPREPTTHARLLPTLFHSYPRHHPASRLPLHKFRLLDPFFPRPCLVAFFRFQV